MSRGELAEQCTMHRKFYGESPCKNRIEPGEKSALSTEKSENSLFRPAPSPIFPFCRAFLFQRSGYVVLSFPFLDVTKNSTLLNRTECHLVSHRSKLSNGNEDWSNSLIRESKVWHRTCPDSTRRKTIDRRLRGERVLILQLLKHCSIFVSETPW